MLLKSIFLAAAALLPGLAQAQFILAPGTYQLANGSKGEASLKLMLAENGSPTMMVGVKNGKERRFRAAEVTYFTVENHRFVRVNDFRFLSGTDADFKEPALLEILETGPVELFYYHYQVEMGPNFKAHVKLLVLRKAGTPSFLAYAPGRTPGFDSKLASGTFVAALFPADPVLQRQFATNGITRAHLADVVRAYNQGVRLKP
ncbi:hypothetical protein [Hymenobacter ruricola]|uniref:DUF4369 domain-containing protein n=1 Tax=Hymenobacter ruricola TaxID=2791023 RepID=A0ABS0IB07_9BACT|nr:hypothetical protein [Hymenobacter ruricola]MBF9224135.1 hypothetical protein [Hymenobacter ruricola]